MTATETLTRVPRRSARATWGVFDHEVVLLDTRRRVMIGLNPTGGAVWELVDGCLSVQAIGERIAARFDRPLAAVLDDVVAFLELLHDRGAIEFGRG